VSSERHQQRGAAPRRPDPATWVALAELDAAQGCGVVVRSTPKRAPTPVSTPMRTSPVTTRSIWVVDQLAQDRRRVGPRREREAKHQAVVDPFGHSDRPPAGAGPPLLHQTERRETLAPVGKRMPTASSSCRTIRARAARPCPTRGPSGGYPSPSQRALQSRRRSSRPEIGVGAGELQTVPVERPIPVAAPNPFGQDLVEDLRARGGEPETGLMAGDTTGRPGEEGMGACQIGLACPKRCSPK
jgi:hypothetical protein